MKQLLFIEDILLTAFCTFHYLILTVTLWKKWNLSVLHMGTLMFKEVKGAYSGEGGRVEIWTHHLNHHASCVSPGLKLVGTTEGTEPNHFSTLCFSRSSLATSVWPHWTASMKGVRPHLSLQSGSYWHLEPRPKATAENSHRFKPDSADSGPPALQRILMCLPCVPASASGEHVGVPANLLLPQLPIPF